MHRNHNSRLLNFWVIALCLFHTWTFSGAYLQNYTSYGYEILWVDRSHLGGVQCTWTVTLACSILELLPFVYFHTWTLSGAYLQNYTSYGYEILWVDRSLQVGVHYLWTITLACFIFELLPFVYFHTWILSGASLQNYTRYGYEILWVDRSHLGGLQCRWTVTLACLVFELLPFVYFHTISKTILAMFMKCCGWIDLIKGGGGKVQCKWTVTLACLIFELLPFVYFYTWILSGAYLQNYTSYGYEILWVFTRWNKFRSLTEKKQIFCLFHAFNPFWEKLYQNPVQFFPLFPVYVPLPHSNVLQYYIKRVKCKLNDVIFPSGC